MNSHLLKPNQVIADRYIIEKYHGEGGMQQVYLAQDLTLNKTVALKIPKDKSGIKRFTQSAVASAKVNHPNVAKALDYIPSSSYEIYIEEFIEGYNLSTILVDYFYYFDPHLATRFALQISRGLAASHHAGVIHRDIKPANIMVSVDQDKMNFKITDFGIAKLVEEDFATAHRDSTKQSSTFLGAIPYMAPELIVSTDNASLKSDIWSFGALLYSVVFGRTPFGYGPAAVSGILSGNSPGFTFQFQLKRQFSYLANELTNVVRSCLIHDANSRPSADELVTIFNKICFRDLPYKSDFLLRAGQNGAWWHTQDNYFVHPESFWGDNSHIQMNMPLYLGIHDGFNRAYPIIPLKAHFPSLNELTGLYV